LFKTLKNLVNIGLKFLLARRPGAAPPKLNLNVASIS